MVGGAVWAHLALEYVLLHLSSIFYIVNLAFLFPLALNAHSYIFVPELLYLQRYISMFDCVCTSVYVIRTVSVYMYDCFPGLF